ncbi:hypothetical protein [Cloacibacterium caeni]|uniref:hypothetical protein n=1 Tax=Cloacibacterium caeni TaxID=2004710 RepID=UPI001BCAA548|nr:hypothetical protein [Cloacibacterium caeni]
MKKFILVFLFFSFLFSFSQKTEKLALRKYKIATLSDSLKETSGLTFLKDKLYTLNDGGNTNEIFEIDKISGKILSKLKINFPNKDWEAMTSDGENFYIGDFGNNAGNRKDLAIYKTDFQGNYSKNSFNYSAQDDFSTRYLSHNFDAEAMIFLNEKVHVFSKEWSFKNISHYTIDLQNSENQSLVSLESFHAGFVITDAAYFEGKLYVVGYTRKAKVYMMIFEENSEGLFFSKPLKKYKLGSFLSIGQVEGIAVNKEGIYISNEDFSKFIFSVKQRLYFISFEKLK